MVALHNNRLVLLDERIFGAYSVWSSVAFQCLTGHDLFNHASQFLCLQLTVVGGEDELGYDYIQAMMTQFCTANWPQFTTISNEMLAKGMKLTVTDFLKEHANNLEVNSKSMLLLADLLTLRRLHQG